MKNKINYKVFAAIIILSSAIGLIYNALNFKGIELIRKPKEVAWASDSLFQNSDSTIIKSSTNSDVQSQKKQIDSSVIKPIKNKEIIANYDSSTKIIKPVFIKAEQAYKLYKQGKTLFVDARDKWDFADGHIKGAINIPEYSFDKSNPILKTIPKGKIIVTYCGGDDCEMSEKLGDYLFELGYKNVFIFFGGWKEWQAANYPSGAGEE